MPMRQARGNSQLHFGCKSPGLIQAAEKTEERAGIIRHVESIGSSASAVILTTSTTDSGDTNM